jgi:hypothetical protein
LAQIHRRIEGRSNKYIKKKELIGEALSFRVEGSGITKTGNSNISKK